MARPLGWWTTAVESVQTAVEAERGTVVVLANALSFAAEPLYQAQRLLPTLQPGENSAKLDGYLYVATVLLQSVLDSIASAAQRLAPLPEPQGAICFKSYPFVLSDVVWISPIQARLLRLKFDGKTFFDLANAAWVVSEHKTTAVLDVHDRASVGLLYQVLVPVYDEAKTIICRLAKLVGQPVPDLYKL